MNRGVLLFAHNNKKIDYIKQAIFCAKKIKKHLDRCTSNPIQKLSEKSISRSLPFV